MSAIKGESKQEAKESEAAGIRTEIEALTVERYFLDYYLPHSQRSKRGWKADISRFKTHILPSLGTIPLFMLKEEDVQRLRDNLFAQDYAAGTVSQILTLLNSAINRASKIIVHGQPLFSGKNPATGIKLPRLVNARERYLMPKEANRLLAAAKGLPALDLHDAIILALYAGLRRGEIFRLQWTDIHLDHATLNVREEDRRKPGGKVPLNGVCINMLSARKERSKGQAMVFPEYSADSRYYILSKIFLRLVENLGLNDGLEKTDRQHRIVFHSLRHTFASWLAINGTDIYRIKTLMRHKTIDMTMRYAHLIPDATRSAVDLLPIPDCSNP